MAHSANHNGNNFYGNEYRQMVDHLHELAKESFVEHLITKEIENAYYRARDAIKHVGIDNYDLLCKCLLALQIIGNLCENLLASVLNESYFRPFWFFFCEYDGRYGQTSESIKTINDVFYEWCNKAWMNQYFNDKKSKRLSNIQHMYRVRQFSMNRCYSDTSSNGTCAISSPFMHGASSAPPGPPIVSPKPQLAGNNMPVLISNVVNQQMSQAALQAASAMNDFTNSNDVFPPMPPHLPHVTQTDIEMPQISQFCQIAQVSEEAQGAQAQQLQQVQQVQQVQQLQQVPQLQQVQQVPAAQPPQVQQSGQVQQVSQQPQLQQLIKRNYYPRVRPLVQSLPDRKQMAHEEGLKTPPNRRIDESISAPSAANGIDAEITGAPELGPVANDVATVEDSGQTQNVENVSVNGNVADGANPIPQTDGVIKFANTGVNTNIPESN